MPLRLEAFFKLLQLRITNSVSAFCEVNDLKIFFHCGICNNPVIILAMLEVLPLIKDPEKKCTMLMRVSLYKTNVIVSVNGAS